jgi:hypothetical protein
MNLIKQLKERHPLEKLKLFEKLYAQIEREAKEVNDPRVDNPGGVSEQLQAIREAIYELSIDNGVPIPNVTVNVKTLVLKAQRGVDIKE